MQMADNNLPSIKIGNKIYSYNDTTHTFDDVSASYNDVTGNVVTGDDIPSTDVKPADWQGGTWCVDLKDITSELRYYFYGAIYWKENTDQTYSVYAVPLSYVRNAFRFIYSTDIALNSATGSWDHIPTVGDSLYFQSQRVELTEDNIIPLNSLSVGDSATYIAPKVYKKPLIYNPDLDAIEKSLGNVEVVGELKAANVNTPEITTEAITADEITVDDLTVNNTIPTLTVANLSVTTEATINHATIVTEEDIHSEDDFIELRVNNPLPTPSTGSGIKINNYDGNDNDLNLITTADGTLRIGEPGDEEPLLTRNEATNLSNGAPLVWDATNLRANTTSTNDGNKVLKSVKNSSTGVVTYEWSSSGSGAVWRGTRAQLTTALLVTDPNDEAYIPNNALIIITDADDTYLTGEIQ